MPGSVVQSAAKVSGFGASVTVTFPGSTPVTNGNSITLKMYKGADAVSVTSVADNTSTALNPDLSTSLETDNEAMYYSLHGITDGPISVTINFSGSVNYTIFMDEVFGITSTVVQTIVATADGAGFATAHSWAYTAANAEDFGTFLGGIYTGFVDATATATGNTVMQDTGAQFSAVCYEFAPASGANSATFNLDNTRQCNYSGVVYAAAAAGGGIYLPWTRA